MVLCKLFSQMFADFDRFIYNEQLCQKVIPIYICMNVGRIYLFMRIYIDDDSVNLYHYQYTLYPYFLFFEGTHTQKKSH